MDRDFTPQEEQDIVASPEFEKFLKTQRNKGNPDVSIDAFMETSGNRTKWQERFDNAKARENAAEGQEIIVLASLDKYKEIGEVIRALRDEDFKSDFIEKVAAAYEAKKAGNMEAFNAQIAELQASAKEADFKNIGLAMDDKGYMYDSFKQVEKTVEMDVPDLSKLILHNRNHSETSEIVKKLREGASPEDLVILDAVIKAYANYNDDKESVAKLNDLIKTDKDVALAIKIAQEVQYDNAWDVPTLKKQVSKSVWVDNKGNEVDPKEPNSEIKSDPKTQPNPIVLDGQVLRGWNSDEWQQLIDGKDTEFLNALNFAEGVEIEALRAIGKLPNIDGLEPDKKAEALQKALTELSPVELAKFNGAMNSAAEKLLETYPPKFMVFLHKRINADLALEDKKKDKDANTVAILQAQKDALWQSMVNKLDGYNKGAIVVDQSNIADVYDGASEMFAYIKEQDSKLLAEQCKKAQDKLDAEIKTYDETNGFDKVDEKKAADIEKAFDKTSKLADEIKIEDMPEIKAMIDGLEFESDDKSSADDKKKTFLEIIRNEAARNAAVKGFADKEEDLKNRLAEELKQSATVQTGALIATNELLKAEASGEPANLDPKVLAENTSKTIAELESGKKVKISNKAVAAHAANTVNDTMGYLSRLSSKIGKGAPVLKKMYDKISHLDKTSIQRFGPIYEGARTFGSALRRNMGSQLLNQGVRFGLTSAAMMAGYPGLGSVAYGAFYCGQAAWRLTTKYKQQKKQNGGKLNGLKFLAQNLPEIAMTTLTTTAIICGGTWAGKAVEVMGHALPLDKMVSYGAMAIGYTTSLVKGFRASRKEGNSFWKSLGKSVSNSTLSTATGFLAAYGIGSGINAVSSNLHFESPLGEHATKHITASEYNENAQDTEHYSKDVVTDAHNHNGVDVTKLTPEQLNEKGIIIESAQASDEGAFVVKEAVEARDEVVYDSGVAENTQNILNQWYGENSEVLDGRINELMTQGNLTQTEAMRCLMQMHDAGVRVPVEQTLYDEHGQHPDHGEAYTKTSNNMKVFGEGWSASTGISQESVNHLAGMMDAQGNIKVTPEGLEAFRQTDMVVGSHNTVGHVDGSPHFHNSPLGHNSHVDAKGEVQAGYGEKGNTQWTTYANSDAVKQIIHHEGSPAEYNKASQVQMQEAMPMTTTFDKFWGKMKSVVLLGRVGSNGNSAEKEKDIRPIRDVRNDEKPATLSKQDKKATTSKKDEKATPSKKDENTSSEKKSKTMTVSEEGGAAKKTTFFGKMFSRSK